MSYQHEDEWVTVTVMAHDQHGHLVPTDIDDLWYGCDICGADPGVPCVSEDE